MDNQPIKRFYRIPDVAEYFSVSRDTVYAWIDRGVLPKPLRLGGTIPCWTLEDLEACIDRRDRDRASQTQEAIDGQS